VLSVVHFLSVLKKSHIFLIYFCPSKVVVL
jgi:hypothetical protein